MRPAAIPVFRLRGEQQEEGDEEGEDAEGFRHGEAEDEAAELAVGSRGIAQCALQELAEQVAHADGGEAHADGSKTGADEFCGSDVHERILLECERYWIGSVSAPGAGRRRGTCR